MNIEYRLTNYDFFAFDNQRKTIRLLLAVFCWKSKKGFQNMT